jgi:two-component system, NarL family, sensor kinase
MMHPRQPDLVGQDLWNVTDEDGRPTIRGLITQARAGGGFVEYRWQRPSQQRVSRKLGYVVPLPRWGWMIGSGIYLDDIDQVTSELRRRSSHAIQQAIWLVAGGAAMGALLVVGYGMAMGASRRRAATMRALARELVTGQEAERERISRDLHDGAMQQLVSARVILEAALARLHKEDTSRSSAGTKTIEQGITRLNEGLEEIHHLSQNLRPLVRDGSLKTLLHRLTREPGPGAEVRVDAQSNDRPMDVVTAMALFRVAQEALGNVDRHSGARLAVVRFEHGDAGATLTVTDNGRGFDVGPTGRGPERGAGLSNMRKRIEALGGRFAIRSGGGGTTVEAWVPGTALRS